MCGDRAGQEGIEGLSLQIRVWMRTGGWPVVGTSEGARACHVLEQGSWLDFRVRAKCAAHLEICSCKSCYLPTCLQGGLQLSLLRRRGFLHADGTCNLRSFLLAWELLCVDRGNKAMFLKPPKAMGQQRPAGVARTALAERAFRSCTSSISSSNTPEVYFAVW